MFIILKGNKITSSEQFNRYGVRHVSVSYLYISCFVWWIKFHLKNRIVMMTNNYKVVTPRHGLFLKWWQFQCYKSSLKTVQECLSLNNTSTGAISNILMIYNKWVMGHLILVSVSRTSAATFSINFISMLCVYTCVSWNLCYNG